MQLLDQTLSSPAGNLALDEALLELCETGKTEGVLRFWEPREYFVVLGISCNTEFDVNVLACREEEIPILRRSSGGGTVLQGPGCLNYALVLPIEGDPLGGITSSTRNVMERNREALAPLLSDPIRVEGTSDLAVGGRKCSGNAQRRRLRSFLFHGTFLIGMDLERIERLLRMPERQPAYRQGRTHTAFLRNLSLDAASVRKALQVAWGAAEPLHAPPLERAEQLVREKYGREEFVRRTSRRT